jgi:hypothetical protein
VTAAGIDALRAQRALQFDEDDEQGRGRLALQGAEQP